MEIMIIYSKEGKTTSRRVEDSMKENREEGMVMGGDFNGRIEIGKKEGGKCRKKETDRMDRRKWMGSVER
jgi:hypothetical protein